MSFQRTWIFLGSVLLIVGLSVGTWHLWRPVERPSVPTLDSTLSCSGDSGADDACALLQLERCDKLTVYALDPASRSQTGGSGEGTVGLSSLRGFKKRDLGASPAAPLATMFPPSEVLAQKELQAAHAAPLLATWRQQQLGQGMNLCFTPHYGLACSVADRVVAEWQVCFVCAQVRYALPQSGRHGLVLFDPRTAAATRLRSLLQAALPHPSSSLFEKLDRQLGL